MRILLVVAMFSAASAQLVATDLDSSAGAWWRLFGDHDR